MFSRVICTAALPRCEKEHNVLNLLCFVGRLCCYYYLVDFRTVYLGRDNAGIDVQRVQKSQTKPRFFPEKSLETFLVETCVVVVVYVSLSCGVVQQSCHLRSVQLTPPQIT